LTVLVEPQRLVAAPSLATVSTIAATVSAIVAAVSAIVAAAIISAVSAVVSAAVISAGVSTVGPASGAEGIREQGRNVGVRNANFIRHPAIAGSCTKSDESAEEGVLGYGLATIGQHDFLNLGLNSGDIDLHT
jgi:uncharacterized protein (DUF362 family)